MKNALGIKVSGFACVLTGSGCIKSLLKKPTIGLVPEVVKMKPGNSRVPAGTDEVLGDRIQSDIPDFPFESSGAQSFLEDCHDNGRERKREERFFSGHFSFPEASPSVS